MEELWLKFIDTEGQSRRERVGGERFIVGRQSDCDLCIPDGKLSREHLEIERIGYNFIVSDLGSSNGTTLNGANLSGRVALSNWDAAERSPFFAAVAGAVAAAEVPTPTEAPAGPSFFHFTDDLAFRALLEDAGFDSVAVDSIPTEIPVASADELITALAEGTVRTGAALRAADDAQRNDMRAALEERLGEWRRGSGFVLPSPMKLASGTKPA